MKVCTICKVEQDEDNFHFSNRKKNYRRCECKSCSRVKVANWRQNNRERFKIRQVAYRSRDDVKKQRSEYGKRWRRENMERSLFLRVRRRCRKEGIEFNLIESDIVIPSHCPVFHTPLLATGSNDALPTVDRINPNGIYEPSNIAIISMRANRIKNDSSLEELKQLVYFLENLENGREHS